MQCDRRVRGLTAKVLNERLKKLLRFGIIERQMFAEVPPRVEYRLTAFGKRFNSVIAQIAALEDTSSAAARSRRKSPV